MKGPTAPKDPEKRRQFFYIIRDKEVFGAKTPDGRESSLFMKMMAD